MGFADKSDLAQHLNAYSMPSPGEVGVGDGGENVFAKLFTMITLFKLL
jgi:hypothetical protein